MSKNITIKEGGTPRNFTAKKLKTNVTGGGTCLWVPEEDVQLVTKSITENGTYKASDDGEYGYSQVSVNIPGGAGGSPGGAGSSIIGTDTDGNDYLIEVEQDGTLDKTKLPSSITVTTPPTKTTYTDGEAIDITGIGIVAYDAEGHPMQLVDASEVTISPQYADKSQASAETYTDGSGISAMLVTADGEVIYDRETPVVWRCSSVPRLALTPHGVTAFITSYNDIVYMQDYTGRVAMLWSDSGGSSEGTWFNFTDNGKFQTTGQTAQSLVVEIPVSTTDPSSKSGSDLTPVGGLQTITVSWPRPGDGKILTTTFDIEVEEATQSGGNQGTS